MWTPLNLLCLCEADPGILLVLLCSQIFTLQGRLNDLVLVFHWWQPRPRHLPTCTLIGENPALVNICGPPHPNLCLYEADQVILLVLLRSEIFTSHGHLKDLVLVFHCWQPHQRHFCPHAHLSGGSCFSVNMWTPSSLLCMKLI